MATTTVNPLKEGYHRATAAYEELVMSTTPYLWAQALNRISEDELGELECRLADIRELEAEQLALLERLLPAQREEVARARAVEVVTGEDGEDNWLDVEIEIQAAEGELRGIMKQLTILRRADLVARRESACW